MTISVTNLITAAFFTTAVIVSNVATYFSLLRNVQIGSGAQAAPYSMGIAVPSRG